MSVAELCSELNERYKQKGSKMPAERHIQQLMDKVRTKEEAELAANAIARFHHERASFFSKPLHSPAANQPPLDGTTPDRGGGPSTAVHVSLVYVHMLLFCFHVSLVCVHVSLLNVKRRAQL